ncbi:MAG: hypothetical protein WCP18_04225 [bacterium]
MQKNFGFTIVFVCVCAFLLLGCPAGTLTPAEPAIATSADTPAKPTTADTATATTADATAPAPTSTDPAKPATQTTVATAQPKVVVLLQFQERYDEEYTRNVNIDACPTAVVDTIIVHERNEQQVAVAVKIDDKYSNGWTLTQNGQSITPAGNPPFVMVDINNQEEFLFSIKCGKQEVSVKLPIPEIPADWAVIFENNGLGGLNIKFQPKNESWIALPESTKLSEMTFGVERWNLDDGTTKKFMAKEGATTVQIPNQGKYQLWVPIAVDLKGEVYYADVTKGGVFVNNNNPTIFNFLGELDLIKY